MNVKTKDTTEQQGTVDVVNEVDNVDSDAFSFGFNTGSGFVKIKPVKSKISTRGKVFEGSSLRLYPLRNSSGKHIILTKEEEEEFAEIIGSSPSDFYENFFIRIPHTGIVLNMDNTRDKMIYAVLKKGLYKEVALDFNSTTSRTLFYISNEIKEAEAFNAKNKIKVEAYAKLFEMSLDDQIKFLASYGTNVRSVNADIVQERLGKLIESDPKEFLNKVKNTSVTQAKCDLNLGIEYGVIEKGINRYSYNEILLGVNEEEAISFLLNKKNNNIRLTLAREISKAIKAS